MNADVDAVKDSELGKENWALDRIPSSENNSTCILPRPNHTLRFLGKIAMAIGEWQLCLDTLERESVGLDVYVQRLLGEKEDARMTLHKVSSQMEYGRKLISDAQKKLSELEAQRDDLRARLVSPMPEDGGLTSMHRDLESLQHRLDAQKGILAVF